MTETIQAEPHEFVFEPEHTDLPMPDTQRGFMEPRDSGTSPGNVSPLSPAVGEAARKVGLFVIYTGSCFSEFQRAGREKSTAWGSVFGWVSAGENAVAALS